MTDCDFPLWGQYLLMSYMIVMLCLFGNFYFQSYINKKRHPKKDDGANGHVKASEQNGSYRKQVKKSQNGSTGVKNGHSNGVVHSR